MPKMDTVKQFGSLIVGACLMTVLASCGSDSGGGSSKKGSGNNSNPQLEVEKIEGKFRAILVPLNSSLTGTTSGDAEVTVIGDDVQTKVSLRFAPEQTVHAQYIYSGTQCPDETFDINNDGYLDPMESATAYGQMLIPLDGDLNSQLEGVDQFPKANGSGSYNYAQMASYARMLSDLLLEDTDSKDELIKLKAGSELQFNGKIIVVHGLHADTFIPPSIRAIGSASERATLPIACGKLSRVVEEDSVMKF